VLCRGASGGNGRGDRDGTPNLLTDPAGAKDTPDRQSARVNADVVSDPFADTNTHVGTEFMVVSNLDLLDRDHAFRLFFVDRVVNFVQRIREQSSNDQGSTGSTIDWDKFAHLQQNSPFDNRFFEIAKWVFENEHGVYLHPGSVQASTYAKYFDQDYPNRGLDQYFYVVYFLARLQQYSNSSFEEFKQLARLIWQVQQQPYTPGIEMVLFDKVLEEVDQQQLESDAAAKKMNARLDLKRKTEAEEAEEHASKAESINELINENVDFKRYETMVEGLTAVTRHTFAVYSRLNNLSTVTDEVRVVEWRVELDKKSITKKLYEKTEKLMISARPNFKQLHPKKMVQWRYWTMRAINDLTTAEEGSNYKAWSDYIANAALLGTTHKVMSSDFPLQSNLQSFHADDITHNAVESLSTRIDLLNDW
jgi:hypothetical protein